ncbi:MAG TPA: acetyl-CoA carboxylase biotin carboxylase subunit [Fibrobacteria bacterium]|nr:acetyl-CoA carboxylase biotin carboxylase subunit [Fibrobacteria bacterium]
MMKKILIANRGEIALRVIRACKEMGIRTVAVHSTADADSLHVKLADEDVCIGPPPGKKSYLDMMQILSAAVLTGADAVHPGYGFLSENARFAELVGKTGMKFIGPSPEAISRMGDKSEAKDAMRAAGVPTIPGSDGPVKDLESARKWARTIGFPMIVKAVAGGGGRGMRVVRDAKELETQFPVAVAEAQACFGNGSVYMERYFERPRHVEIQLMADSRGNVVHLGERDCSVQRRHQKLVEESPSPAVDDKIRQAMGKAAVKGAKSVGYENAGTMEFLLDEDGSFYFMEMNTRIQVEHPVTELVTGVDLVRAQILVAMGEALPWKQSEIKVHGHSIECRINAEDPSQGFRPCPGPIKGLHVPGGMGVRWDSHIYSGYVVPPYYDSMIGKLIVHAPDRTQAIERMIRVLDELVVEGPSTTANLQRRILDSKVFRSGKFTTKFIEENPQLLEV